MVAQRTIAEVLKFCTTVELGKPVGAGPMMAALDTAPVKPDQLSVYVRIRVSLEYQISMVPNPVEGVTGTLSAPVMAMAFFLNSVIFVNSVSRLQAVSNKDTDSTNADIRRNFMSS